MILGIDIGTSVTLLSKPRTPEDFLIVSSAMPLRDGMIDNTT